MTIAGRYLTRDMRDISRRVERGLITINQARSELGLSRLPDDYMVTPVRRDRPPESVG